MDGALLHNTCVKTHRMVRSIRNIRTEVRMDTVHNVRPSALITESRISNMNEISKKHTNI